MASISFLEVTYIKNFQVGDEFFGRRQTDLPTFTQESLPEPKTRAKITHADERGYGFFVEQEGPTKNDPIRVYWRQLENPIAYVEQWQPVSKFKAVYTHETSELALFCGEDNRDLFIKRIEPSDIKMKLKPFDLKKLMDNQDFSNIWGIWSIGDGGRISRRAIFGRNLDRTSEYDPEEITTLNVELQKPDGTMISLVISKDGRIFAMGKIGVNELYQLYETIRPNLY